MIEQVNPLDEGIDRYFRIISGSPHKPPKAVSLPPCRGKSDGNAGSGLTKCQKLLKSQPAIERDSSV
jgi:hypothetical protein